MIPKPNDKFNALTKVLPHVAIGCPCICRSVEKYDKAVHAKDADGEQRVFFSCDFTFEICQPSPKQRSQAGQCNMTKENE
jgi:hypothetical protein